MEAKVRVNNAEFTIDGQGKITGLRGKIEELKVGGRKLPLRKSVGKDLSDIPKIVKLLSDLNQFLDILPEGPQVVKTPLKKEKKKKKFVKPNVKLDKPSFLKDKGNRIAKVRDCYIYDGILSAIMKQLSASVGKKIKRTLVEKMVKEDFGFSVSALHYHLTYLIETGFITRGGQKSEYRGYLIKKGRTAEEVAQGAGTFPNLIDEKERLGINPELLAELEEKFRIKIVKRGS